MSKRFRPLAAALPLRVVASGGGRALAQSTTAQVRVVVLDALGPAVNMAALAKVWLHRELQAEVV